MQHDKVVQIGLDVHENCSHNSVRSSHEIEPARYQASIIFPIGISSDLVRTSPGLPLCDTDLDPVSRSGSNLKEPEFQSGTSLTASRLEV